MKRPFLLFALLALASLSLHAFALPGPTSASFARGAKFTVSGYTGASTLSGFPVLVRIAENSPSGFSYDDLQSKATGDDIAFVDMDGTGLPFEIDTWDPNGTSLIWVRLPSMQSGTEFVMCWGSDSSGRAVSAAKPWADYTGVWHMNEETAGVTTIHDSTANALHGTSVATSSSKTDGKVGRARFITSNTANAAGSPYDSGVTIDMTDDATKLAAVDAIVPEFTASFWVRPQNNAQWWYFITRKAADKGPGWGLQNGSDGNNSSFKVFRAYGGTEDDTQCVNLTGIAALEKSKWVKLDAVWKTDKTFLLYVNGAQTGTGTLKNQAANGNQTKLALGGAMAPTANDQKSGRGVYGDMDEIRLRAGALSPDWIAADYATVTNAAFLTAGMAEPYEETDDPVAGVQVSDVAYTNATVTATVVKRGGAATSADVTVALSAASDFASSLWTTNYTVSADGDVQVFPVTGLSVGTSYYVRAVVSNTLDAVLTTPATSFTTLTPGAPAGTATFLERGFTTLSATGAATAFGTGAQSATLCLEASTDGFATVAAASAEVPATVGAAETPITVSGLNPATSYALRLRIRNDWGVDTFVALPDAATRAVPFATTGLGWTFSADGSTVDITFGVSGVYDGATGSATLYYGESANPTTPQGAKPVNTAGDLLWQSLPVSAKTMYAKVILSATLDGTTYTQTYTAPLTAGSTSVAVSDIMNHASAATAVRVHPGDVVTLPELSGTARYIVGNKLFGSLEGNVLTALRPGILGIHCVGNDGATNTMAVLVLPEKIGNGDIYVFKETSISGNNNGVWCAAGSWEKVGAETNDSWPQNEDDIAIIPFYSLESKSVNLGGDVTVGTLYVGGFRDTKANITLGTNNSGYKRAVSFRRTDGGSVAVQLCSNSLYRGNNEFRVLFTLSSGLRLVDFLSDTVLSGGWDGLDPNFPQGRFVFSSSTNRIEDGVLVELREMDTQPQGNSGYTTAIGNLAGGGTFWNHSAAMVRVNGNSGAFTGLIRDSGGYGAGTTDRTGPMVIRTETTTNCTGEVVGWVPRSGGDPDSNFTRGVGCFESGGIHSYNVPAPHNPWFTKKGFSMHGGMFRIGSDQRTDWETPDKRLVDFFRVGGGFNYIHGHRNNANNSIAWFEADSVVHEGVATLRIRDQSLFETSATNMVTILHGVAQYAVGAGEDPKTSNAASIVPWIVAQAGSKESEDLRFAAFDANDRLSRVVNDKNAALSSYGPNDNAYVFNKDLSISSDATFNSLVLVNDGRARLLGEGRTLTLASGGLILEDLTYGAGSSGITQSAAIGTENGGAANGFLVLGDATHPAYVWARGLDKPSDNNIAPNEIWAEVSAPGGFVAAGTGDLILGGNQTNILGEIVVNAGTLQLGTAASSCRLRKDLPIRLYANATLKLPNADSTGGKLLYFDGAAGWFGTVEVADGVATKCKKAYWRDYPETPDWQSLPRGVYGSSASSATGDFVRDDLFAGAGTLQVVSDDCVDPTILILR